MIQPGGLTVKPAWFHWPLAVGSPEVPKEACAVNNTVNDTELIQRGGGYSQRGDGAQPLFLLSRSNPPTEGRGGGREKTSECIIYSHVERLRDLLSS